MVGSLILLHMADRVLSIEGEDEAEVVIFTYVYLLMFVLFLLDIY